jgi:hypothetical protein
LELRGEASNVINRANFGVPVLTMTSSQFGQITSATDPRILQLTLKLYSNGNDVSFPHPEEMFGRPGEIRRE